MELIARAPDGTVFLSTAALIVGIFLAVVAAALVSSLPERLEGLMRPSSRKDANERYRKLIRVNLFILLLVNTLGTLIPLSLLAIDTITTIQPTWIWISFAYTIFVILVNLAAVSMIYIGPMISTRLAKRP